MIVAAVGGSANGLGVVCVAQIWDVRILLELWSVRGEISRTVSGVCAADLDSRSSFGDVVGKVSFGIGKNLVSLVTMSDCAHAKLST